MQRSVRRLLGGSESIFPVQRESCPSCADAEGEARVLYSHLPPARLIARMRVRRKSGLTTKASAKVRTKIILHKLAVPFINIPDILLCVFPFKPPFLDALALPRCRVTVMRKDEDGRLATNELPQQQQRNRWSFDSKKPFAFLFNPWA
jgi:hypothetical protein